MTTTTYVKKVKKILITPNAKLLESLRHLNYLNTEAIADLVDNSIDAGATEIHINFDKTSGVGSLEHISIFDNGCGMDEATLQEAMKLGSNTVKNTKTDLGRFGMGMITASISMGRRISVTTKNSNRILHAVQDLDEIAKNNEFAIDVMDFTDSEVKPLFAGESWTEVVISKIDNQELESIGALENRISQHIGEVFRKFIQSGRKIQINGKEIVAVDPLANGIELFNEEKVLDADGKHGGPFTIKLRGVEINGGKRDLSAVDQGAYLIRNNRQILRGDTLGLWTRHNDLNPFRFEIEYSGDLDGKVFPIEFTKKNAHMTDWARNTIKPFLTGYYNQFRKKAKKARQEEQQGKIDYKSLEDAVTRKGSLLPGLAKRKQTREFKGRDKDGEGVKPSPDPKPRETGKTPTSGAYSKSLYEVREGKMGDVGPIYLADQEGAKTVLTLNTDHSFYMELIRVRSEDVDSWNTIMKLLLAFARAENEFSEEHLAMIEQIRARVSMAVKVFL